jgi:exoribonuclease-2
MSNNDFKNQIRLTEIAELAMRERGFFSEFPKQVENEVSALHSAAEPRRAPIVRDMRQVLWVSIDNDDSLDLDQLTFAQKGMAGIDKIFIAVADVDSLVKKGSAIDRYAGHNTTSVYTPTKNFPMLPPKLSTDLTSLNPDVDRSAVVVEIDVDQNGEFIHWEIYPAAVRNKGKLTYNKVAAFLEHGQKSYSPEINTQLTLQDEIAQRILAYRIQAGALSFASIEVEPLVRDEWAIGLVERVQNRAHHLIENFMIAANVAVSRFHADKKLPTIRRIVRQPERWERIVALAQEKGTRLPNKPDSKALRDFLTAQEKKDPERFPDLSLAIIKLIGRGEYVLGLPGEIPPGHFDLALLYYAHSTAPNRRYPDLIMQRLLKSYLYSDPLPYTHAELTSIATRCTEKEDDATKVERRVRKSAEAMVLSSQIGHTFPAFVTGASPKGTWVRLLIPPIEGKLVQGFQGVDVGDRVSVKLIKVDIANGFIDFARN